MNTATVEKLVLELRQIYPVSRERLFAAWTNPQEARAWFGPEGAEASDVQMDVRLGGRYSISLNCEGKPCTAIGEYREVTPPSRLVFTWQWKDDPEWENIESEITIEFIEKLDGTELHFVQTGFPTAESRNDHEHGWTGSLTKLGRVVEA